MNKSDDEKSTQVSRMLQLLSSFIFHTVETESFHSSLVHFLTVLEIDKKMNQLQRADNYSFMLVRVIYCMHMLRAEILLSCGEQKHQEEAEQEYFLQQQQRFLTDKSYSSMSTMINLLTYSK